ncbi:hypothetical protein ACFQAT_29050 [Undibacterium arcticum]|uniref:Uncharacterized protein n=1 Tax=Undibacterium arcticum TaxID=1762892 RepID=A0ABV7FAR2_9BURK
MGDDNDLNLKIVSLYRRICSAIDVPENSSQPDAIDAADLPDILSNLRSLGIELSNLLNVEDEAYSTEVSSRIRVIEREIQVWLAALDAVHTHIKQCHGKSL